MNGFDLQLFDIITHRIKLDNQTQAASKIVRAFFARTELEKAIKDDPEVSFVATCDGRPGASRSNADLL